MFREIAGHTRPVPFSVRPAVREQIMEFIADKVLGISTSRHVNPLPKVLRSVGLLVRFGKTIWQTSK
jgi:hypothetical protein